MATSRHTVSLLCASEQLELKWCRKQQVVLLVKDDVVHHEIAGNVVNVEYEMEILGILRLTSATVVIPGTRQIHRTWHGL